MGAGNMGGMMAGGGGGSGMGSGSSVGSKRSIDSDGSGNLATEIDRFLSDSGQIGNNQSIKFHIFSCRTRMQENEQWLRLSITKLKYATSNASCSTSKQKTISTLLFINCIGTIETVIQCKSSKNC